MALFEQLKSLYDHGLYSNVSALGSMILSISDHSSDLLSFTARYQSLIYYADSLFHSKEFRKAESVYRKALQLKKSIAKSRGKTQPLPQGDVTSEIDVKYQIHLCNVNLKQFTPAIAVLESIAGKQRTPRINMSLAQLYHQNGMERSAITGYKEVLKECPLAIKAAQGLLVLGVKGTEVAALVLSGSANFPNMEWLSLWIKAHSHMHAKELSQSITTFKQLDSKTLLRDNTDILVSMGEAHYYNGDYQNALSVLERAHSLDPLLLKGMDVYAALLAKEKKVKELESLSSQLISISDTVPEPWIAMAYYCYITKKRTRAVNFAQKACMINPRHIEALLLKGTILLELKRVQDAITHFGEAYKIAPYRYEPHKGLVDCYLALHRTREAIAIASNACKQLGQTARALTLYASVLTKDPLSADKAKALLEKALKQDSTYLNAVYQLAGIYEQERMYEKGIELDLEMQKNNQRLRKLQKMSGSDTFFIWCNHCGNEQRIYPHRRDIEDYLLRKNASVLESTRIEIHLLSWDHTYEDIGKIIWELRNEDLPCYNLKKQMEQQSTCRLHQMLGDFLARTNEHEKALHHFSIALNMDPTNNRAIEGSQRVEQNPESSESFDVEVEDIADSENEAELEESEVEAVWSDVDYS